MTDSQTYYHGTKADLKVGDLIAPGHASNYGRHDHLEKLKQSDVDPIEE